MSLRLVKILLVSAAGILIAINIAGCPGVANYPKIQVQDRPKLDPITYDEWAALPQPIRNKLTRNQELLFTYVDQLETAIRSYNEHVKTRQ